MINMIYLIVVAVFAIIFTCGIRIVRPTHLLIVETLGKYSRTEEAGFVWVIPLIQRGVFVNITEQMVDVNPQTVITKDNLNAMVDAIIYYKVKDVKASIYNVDDHQFQLTSLARTTLRAVVGKMSLTEANENRDDINAKVEQILTKETVNYGVEVLRVEIQKIEPPADVQVAMNEVVKAEKEKIAAIDLATAVETRADGQKRSAIKEAEGFKESLVLKAQADRESSILRAEGEAQAFDLINKSFVGNAILLKQLDTVAVALKDNSKIIVDSKQQLVNVIGDMSGVPININKKK